MFSKQSWKACTGSSPPKRESLALIASSSTERPKHTPKMALRVVSNDFESDWRMHMLGQEGDIEPINIQTQRRSTKNGERGWGQTDGHTNVHTNAHVHMNEAHETAEKQTLFIRTPAVHIRERTPLTNTVCKQACKHCPRQIGTQLVASFLLMFVQT